MDSQLKNEEARVELDQCWDLLCQRSQGLFGIDSEHDLDGVVQIDPISREA
jgi:hypothetical protein